MRSSAWMWLAAVLLGAAQPADAQDSGKVGVVMGYPASFGVLWHVTDGIGLRPEVTFSRVTTETTGTSTVIVGPTTTTITSTSTSRGWNSQVGLSGLFYLGPSQDLRLYIAPRAAYVWTRTKTESAASQALTQVGAFESESDGFLAAASIGAHYAPHTRLAVFGELGLAYTNQEGDTGFAISRSTLKTTSFGLRSGVGVVLYF